MTARVRGIRSIEIAMSDPGSAARFYRDIWNLTEVAHAGPAILLRGTGAYHHVLAITHAPNTPALTRITYDAASNAVVDQLYEQIHPRTDRCEQPHEVRGPGGGYGFGFVDPDGWNFAVVADVADYADSAAQPDRPTKV